MRIITGKARGLKLKTPKGFVTRPTSERIKESLFSVINGMIDFDGISVLDLFAGTGALGLEALSRGAATAVFVDERTIDIIADNVKRAHFENISRIIRSNVIKYLNRLSSQDEKFNLIFSDAPYNKGLTEMTLYAIDKCDILKGMMIVEHGYNETMPTDFKHLEQIRHINYGKTTSIDIYKRE